MDGVGWDRKDELGLRDKKLDGTREEGDGCMIDLDGLERVSVYDVDRLDDGVGIPENTNSHVTLFCINSKFIE